MMDKLSKRQRSELMARVRNKNTKPEVLVRKLVHGLGYRYRLHKKELPGKPDLAFIGKRKVVFVHGCFWHGHNCKSGKNIPSTNQDYWINKLKNNKLRDTKNQRELKKAGWDYLIIWECELKDMKKVRIKIISFLECC